MLAALATLCAAATSVDGQTTGAPGTRRDTAVRTLAPVATEGLVLGGGGSRGWAHAGALEGLERRGHDADLVVGTSIGALVGALYAAGYSPDEIQARIRAENWGRIFTPAPLLIGPEREARHPLLVTDRDVDPLRFNRGVVPQWRINRALVGLLFDAGVRSRGDFDRLPRRFRAVATDLRTGDSVVLARGDLARAARASMAVPGVFAPVEWEGRSLVDGGLSTNVPVPVAREMGAGRVIAVDIGRPEEEIEGRGPLQVVGRAIDILQQNAERHSPPADVWVLPRFDPAFYGVTFPSDPDPLFRIGLDAALRDVPAVRDRPARRALPPAPRTFRALRVEAPDSATAALARHILRNAAPGGYDPERVLAAVDRLYTTGLFEGIWPRAEYDAGADPTLVVRVEAQPAISLAGALGYDTDRGGRAWGAWQQNRSFLQAPATLTASASLDRIDQWGAVSLRVFPLRLSPLAFTGGAALREVNVRLFEEGDDEPVDDVDVVRAGGWAGVDYQLLLAERVGSATVRAEWVEEEGGRSGLAVGPYLRVGSPRAEEPIVGLPLEAEAEARWGRFSYRRLAARAGVGTTLAGVRLAAVGDVALASAEAPADALPALGDRHRMPGLRWGQGRGQSLVVGGADAAVRLPIGAFGRVRGRVGGVAQGLGDLENRDMWMAGVEAGLVFSTPFGAVHLSYGVNGEGGDLLRLDLGPRF